MKKIILFVLLLCSCESMKIPVEPYVITRSEKVYDDLFKYEYISCGSPSRYDTFLSRKIYSVGDTIQFEKVKL